MAAAAFLAFRSKKSAIVYGGVQILRLSGCCDAQHSLDEASSLEDLNCFGVCWKAINASRRRAELGPCRCSRAPHG